MPQAYKLSAVAKAVGIPVKKLASDLDRKVIKIPGPEPGKGKPRLAKLSKVYEIAIGHALTKVFVPPTNAMNLAQLFVEPQRGRNLGRPFGSGKTLMLITDGVGSIINLHVDEDISTYLQEATIVVNLGAIISKLNLRLIQ
jgi:hypothetical protein